MMLVADDLTFEEFDEKLAALAAAAELAEVQALADRAVRVDVGPWVIRKPTLIGIPAVDLDALAGGGR